MKSADLVKRFEHSVLRVLRMQGLERSNALPPSILVATSGGVDSMVLLSTLRQWQPLLKFRMIVAHVHHGKGTRVQRKFRDQAQAFVKKICSENELEFVTNLRDSFPEKPLKSESEFRDFRWAQLILWKQQLNADFVVLAHHRDDLLETQILRLLRGTSVVGLNAMTIKNGDRLRPFLGHSRAEILNYAKAKKLNWIEDPSNQQNDSALRNWVRNQWLKDLEKRSPGAKKSLASSLQQIAQMTLHTEALSQNIWANGGMRRSALVGLSKKQQSEVVVEYLHRLGLTNYQRTQVNELLRRLDSGKNNTTFSLLGLSWDILPDLVLASRV